VGRSDLAHKEQLLAAAVRAHCAVTEGNVYANGMSLEILRYPERCSASAERVQNYVSDIAVQLHESAWQLWWEFARMIKVVLRVSRWNDPHIARPRLKFVGG